MMWKTLLTQNFPCTVPIVGAPMAGVAGGLLAAETCRAGGLGMIAAGYLSSPQALDEQVDLFRAAAAQHSNNNNEYPLSIGFIGHGTFSDEDGWERYRSALAKHRPAVVQCFAPTILTSSSNNDGNGNNKRKRPLTNVDLAHEYGAKFIAQVGSIAEAKVAIEAGADAIIAQGSEAGGHGLRRDIGSGTLSIVSQVARLVDTSCDVPIPVIAAGGIVNGAGVAAALALCDGAVLGTRLWASQESIGNIELQQQLVADNSCDDVVRTTVFDHIENKFSSTPWPKPYDSTGVLRNEISAKYDGQPAALEAAMESGTLLEDYRAAQSKSDSTIVKVLAGEGVGEIHTIEPAYDIVTRIEQETKDCLQRMSTLLIE